MKLGFCVVSMEIVSIMNFRSIPSIVSELEPGKSVIFWSFLVHPLLLNQP